MATSYEPHSFPPTRPDLDWSLLPTVRRHPVRPQGYGVIFGLLAIVVGLILPIVASMH